MSSFKYIHEKYRQFSCFTKLLYCHFCLCMTLFCFSGFCPFIWIVLFAGLVLRLCLYFDYGFAHNLDYMLCVGFQYILIDSTPSVWDSILHRIGKTIFVRLYCKSSSVCDYVLTIRL